MSEKLFVLGEFWISKDENSPNLYRYHYDPERKKVVRRSLKTTDLEKAKIRLAEHVAVIRSGVMPPADVTPPISHSRSLLERWRG